MIVTVDKQNFVVSATREPSEAQTESAIREIHRADALVAETITCKGPWHRKSGMGTPLPITAFDFNVHRGRMNTTCRECRVKSEKSRNGRIPEYKAEPEVPGTHFQHGITPEPVVIVGPVIVPQRWRITIIKRTEVEVSASDFLDAAAQAGDGEVVKVERLD